MMRCRGTHLKTFAVLAAFSLSSLAASACGDDEGGAAKAPATEKAQPVKAGGASTDPEAKAAAAKKAGGKGGKGGPQPLVTYPKVDDALYRIAFAPEMFAPDMTGDKNRDPFRSYLVDDQAQAVQTGKNPLTVDECDKRMVAEQYGLRDLELVGIVKKGTTAYGLFTDTQKFGHIARRGDCLSKDKARVKEIGQSSIIVEVRGDAPPGQPAPEPREEEWRLHPEQLDLAQPREGTGDTP